jgi:hypothetical protein
MSAVLSSPGYRRLSRVLPVDHAIARANRHILRYQLMVAAQSAATVVDLAGGWIFDRVMAGWDVTVLVADPADPLPARILGAEVAGLADIAALRRGPAPQALAVAALDDVPAEIHAWMLDCLGSGQQEITVWGAACPADVLAGTEAAQYLPSIAARAFKARARAAANLPPTGYPDVESYRTAGKPEPAVVEPVRESPGGRAR